MLGFVGLAAQCGELQALPEGHPDFPGRVEAVLREKAWAEGRIALLLSRLDPARTAPREDVPEPVRDEASLAVL